MENTAVLEGRRFTEGGRALEGVLAATRRNGAVLGTATRDLFQVWYACPLSKTV